MSHPYNTFLDSIRQLTKAIEQEVINHGGFIRLVDDEDKGRYTPYGITSEFSPGVGPDTHNDVRILALKYDKEQKCLAFFADPILLHCNVVYTDEDILSDDLIGQWYYLDWDCSNPFIHNLERIAHYLWPDLL